MFIDEINQLDIDDSYLFNEFKLSKRFIYEFIIIQDKNIERIIHLLIYYYANNSAALLDLGCMYYYGDKIEQNYSKAK